MKRRIILLSFLIHAALLTEGVATGANLQDLMEGLETGDEARLVQARQMLPHQGIETIPLVIPFLSSPDERVWRTAYNILADFAGEVTLPGREKDREKVAIEYMNLVLPETSDHSKEWGLRLLPLVVPDEFDLSPLAALLQDENWREKARETLETLGNDEARGVLRAALKKTDPGFQVALIRSLGHLKDRKSLPILTTLLADPTPEVRSAAALAVAFSGEMGFLSPLKIVLERATPETRTEALTAWLQLAESMATQPENRTMAAGAYRTILEGNAGIPLESAAIVGLGKIGDASSIASILKRLSAEGGRDLEPAAAAAFRATDDKEGQSAWVAAFPSLSESLKYSLLVAMGSQADPAYVPVLLTSLEGVSPEVRDAAFEALSRSGSSAAVEPLVAQSKGATGDDVKKARAYLANLATSLMSSNSPEEAWQVYLELYRVAEKPEEKASALEGLARYPSPESLEVLLGAVKKGEGGASVSRALAKLAHGFVAQGDPKKAHLALEALLNNAKTAEGVRQAHASLSEAGGDADKASRDLGFVLDWWVGPSRPWDPAQKLNDEALGKPDFDLQKMAPRNGLTDWKSVTAGGFPPTVNLAGLLGEIEHQVADGFTVLESPTDQDAAFLFGSDDGIKIWLNGEAIHENPADRGADIDQDRATGHLKKGKNLLVVRITQGGGGWNFLGRIAKPDGSPLPLATAKPQE